MPESDLSPPREGRNAAMNKTMTKVTMTASAISGVLMLFGFILYLLSGSPIPGKSQLQRVPSPPLSQFLTLSLYKTPSAYLGLGLLVLSCTPILRILVALEFFWRANSRRNIAAAGGVLLIILLSIILAWR